ncbi:MAG TPA: FxLYD domain-containing protein [Thermodesulfobacteriota bacterium]|nr:FxLYD domain-containing protein [Thermodesulfobacteriota bacterium]
MKKVLILLLITSLSLLWACAGPDETGSVTVTLDGPILESINQEGNLEFNGAVVNSGDTPVNFVEVVLILKDDNGKVVEASSTSVIGEDSQSLLQPSERAFFTITAKSDPKRIASKEVEIISEGASDLPPSS